VPHPRIDPDTPGRLQRLAEGLKLFVDRLVFGRVGVGEVTPDADDLDRAFGLGLGGEIEQGKPVACRGAASAETGVDF
jgi:hypothetical protein